MPLYMDIHRDVEDLTREAVRSAHAADLEVQEKHGAEYIKYWFNEETGFVSCPFRAPRWRLAGLSTRKHMAW